MEYFHDVRLPRFIEVFLGSRIEFNTNCHSTLSGREIRYSNNSMPKWHYVLSNCVLSQEEYGELNNFFLARNGCKNAFMLRDAANSTAEKVFLAEGDDETIAFPLLKSYGDHYGRYYKRILKPVVSSLKLYIDGVMANYDFNQQKSIVILPFPLARHAILTADFTFDMIVRFSSDSFTYHNLDNGCIKIDDLTLQEVLCDF